jgi:cyclase
MLKVRIMPTLLWKNLGLVKGVAFDSWRRVGTVLPAIKVYNARDVDELVLLDISATEEDRDPDYDTIQELCAECFVPLTIGGGVRNLEQIQRLLRCGADKIAINTAAYENPELITQAANRFGSQCVVVSIDAKRMPDGTYQCFSHAGQRPTGYLAADWAEEMERRGAGEILLTSIDRDGTMEGYELPLLREVVQRVSIPVIASGGAGNAGHLYEAIVEVGASAVAAASMFHFTEQTPLEMKKYLSERHVQVRSYA